MEKRSGHNNFNKFNQTFSTKLNLLRDDCGGSVRHRDPSRLEGWGVMVLLLGVGDLPVGGTAMALEGSRGRGQQLPRVVGHPWALVR